MLLSLGDLEESKIGGSVVWFSGHASDGVFLSQSLVFAGYCVLSSDSPV